MTDGPTGTRAIVRLARRLTGASVRAAALVRRADTVQDGLAGRELREAPRIVTLPPLMLLVLLERDVLLLAASRGWLPTAPGTVLSRWPAGAVDIAVRPGCGPFRPVRIAGGGWTLTVAASLRQRAALRLLEARTRAKDQ
jgi:hypothetical protein